MTSHDADTSGCGFTLVMMVVLVVSAWWLWTGGGM